MRRVEPARLVKARLRGFQEPEPCLCEDCQAWGVEQPPVWVPAPAERLDGVWTRMAQQLHGKALLDHLRAVESFSASLSGHGGGAR